MSSDYLNNSIEVYYGDERRLFGKRIMTDVLLPGTGPQQVTASYLGDSTFNSSTSNTLALRTPLPVTIRLVIG